MYIWISPHICSIVRPRLLNFLFISQYCSAADIVYTSTKCSVFFFGVVGFERGSVELNKVWVFWIEDTTSIYDLYMNVSLVNHKTVSDQKVFGKWSSYQRI